MSVSVNPPKTPVTKGSKSIALATIPNVCKMPGPPAPFVPAPLPNIGKSDKSPEGYSKKVKISGKTVAIQGASFKSMGDIASKGTGGGLLSANTEGPTKFVGPGSIDVKIEGKNVHLLGDPMLNNCGPSGTPPNAATMLGVVHESGSVVYVSGECPLCNEPPHEILKETEESKADAQELADAYNASEEEKRSTMLGVVHCKCSKWKYADQSSGATPALRDAAGSLDMIHPPEPEINAPPVADARLERIRQQAGNDQIFQQTIDLANGLSQISGAAGNRGRLPAAYPPGFCAAQGALVLALDHGGLPTALTEQWHSLSGRAVEAPIAHYNSSSTGIVTFNQGQPGEFGHGDSVPPCGSCDLILPLLLCFSVEEECDHVNRMTNAQRRQRRRQRPRRERNGDAF